MNVAARGASSPSGIGTAAAAGTATWLAKPPSPQPASTRVPTAGPVTSGPVAVTVPATSEPGTNGRGGLIWYRPWTKSPST
ncbi:hypothetical protein SMC26_16970 [Actinomadura fulvescens]|uniref:Uncharacterized protein n=1 Tax=Actinomadura fulvescens TaxID=46160 RepID=A0ABP6CI18_9ACTN